MTCRVTAQMVAAAVESAVPRLVCELAPDVSGALYSARERETSIRGRSALDQLLANANIAASDRVPLCQDTGYVWVCLELGSAVEVAGDVFSLVDEVIARVSERCAMRRSLVRNALSDRSNTGNNTPAVCELRIAGDDAAPQTALLHVMLKGGGSDNASRVAMLSPGAGREGIIREVVSCVREKGANACPPLVIGVGIGSTFDHVGGLAKTALMRTVGKPAVDPAAAELEADILRAVNETGVGPAGLGGTVTALAVHVETAACHIAALPVAINLGCSALRRTTIDLLAPEPFPAEGATASGNAVGRGATSGNAVSGGAHAVGANIAAADGAGGAARAGKDAADAADAAGIVHLTLPEQSGKLAELAAGQRCAIGGTLYTLRDAGHMRLLAELAEAAGAPAMAEASATTQPGILPYGLSGQAIFYAGPSPAAAGRPFGAIGPTTSGRMDFAAPALYDAGVVATLGKGVRSPQVRAACKRNGAVYLTLVGGAAAFLAKCVTSATTIAYEDLGTEALRRIEVEGLPAVVAIDARGNDIYDIEGQNDG